MGKLSKKSIVAILLAFVMAFPIILTPMTASANSTSTIAKEMEYLDRGLVAILTDSGVFLSWRYLYSDPEDIAFNIYKNGMKVNSEPIVDVTNYIDTSGADSSHYQISTIINGVEKLERDRVATWHQQYLPIRLDKPADGRTKLGDYYSYYAGDATVADVDGDGELEIVFLWSPNNSKDNAHSGYTGNVYIDAIKLDGSKLWRIDLGVNIRAGAHYTQLMVYDLNSDGKAEVVVKTSDGTVDGQGAVIGDANADHRNDGGYIITGPEYLTMFDGATGAALSTVNYHPPRGNVSDWGDHWGNRVDRFLAAIAYLDGDKPSVIVSRGYYTRTVIAAYDVVNNELVQKWVFDTDVAGDQYEYQGNHGLSIIDADGDGKDEIMFGALAIDDDGTIMYSTGLGHGDAMHAGKLSPTRPGYQVMSVHESTSAQYGIEMRDAATGEILWGEHTGVDTGRGMSADIDPRYPGYESWATGITDGLAVPITNMYAADTVEDKPVVIVSKENAPKTANFAIWWDGDLQRELFDHDWDNDNARGVPLIYKWDYENNKLDEIFRAEGALTNNHTKGTPALQADIIGDWREEFLVRSEDSREYRLYSTTIPTQYRIPALMQDPTYRVAVAWQNVSYNQPPHTGFYLGAEATEFPKANIAFTSTPAGLETVKHFSFGSGQVAGAVAVGNTLYNSGTGYGFESTAGLSVGEGYVAVPADRAFQVNLPNANYRVTVKLGHDTAVSNTGVKSEFVQKLANRDAAAGGIYTYAYDIAVVDNQLDLTFTGTSNSIKELMIEQYAAKTSGPATTIYMAGDSTMQSYSDLFAPQQGWGEQFGRYFSSEVVVKNHSIGGRSSKSFLFDGRLDNILQEIRPGDFFFISFGHNDASAGIPERYASPTDYKMYLKRYIDGAKQRGATPIILTPVGRRDFNQISQQFNVSFPDYVNAAIEVAEQNDVQLIDLSSLSIAFYNEVGLAATERLFLFTDPGEYPRYPNGVSDSTHFSELGAQAIAKLVAETVKVMTLPISAYVIDPEFVMPEPEPDAQLFEEDFEPDDSVNTYSIVNATGYGGTLADAIVEFDGSHVLRFDGGGSGPRARVFRTIDPIAGNLIGMNFDWHPGEIGITPNKGTISIQDSNENTLLILYAGSDAAPTPIQYSVGPDIVENATVSTVMNKQWVNVDLTINYQEKTMDLTLTSRADPEETTTISGIEIASGINYQENVRAIRFLGTRASGRNLNWTTYLDNVKIEGETLPPKPGDKQPLIDLVNELKARDVTGYSDNSVAVLHYALSEVEDVIEDILTQEQVKHLLNVLTVARDSLTTEAPVPATSYAFDFGSGDAEAGYIKVDSTRAYIPGNHYGFQETSLLVDVNKETGDALREDFIRTGANTFFVELEPANYTVEMVIGDNTEATNIAVTTEQMSKLASTTIPANDYRVITYDIALIDGVFNFEISGTSAKINALTITKLDEKGEGEKPTIYLASDSTVANYAESYRPQSGWGEQLQSYLEADEVVVDNRAISGLSSKTFLVGGYLNQILLDVREGDYLFMQWSHNDSTPSRPERYLTPDEFKVYLKTYIDGVTQRGATPVLVTPVNRRDFTNEGVLNKSFPAYVAAMKEVALETNTALLDLNQVSWEAFQELGPEGTKDIFMWVGTTEDNTHLQVNGATKVAGMVASLLKQSELPIASAVIGTIDPPDPDPDPDPDPSDPGDTDEPWAVGAITGPETVRSGSSFSLNVEVSDIKKAFNTADIELQFDPAKVQFNTIQGEEGAYELAADAITNIAEGVQIIGTAVRPSTGAIRVILLATGEQTVSEAATLFTLNASIKSGLAQGNTTLSIDKFGVAVDGNLGELNIDDAHATIGITAVSKPSTPSPSTPPADDPYVILQKAIEAATQKLQRAVEGSKVGQYKVGAIVKLQQAIEAARSNGNAITALATLNEAVAAFNQERVSLSGFGPISIADLSLLVKYLGVTSQDSQWSEIAKADVLELDVINIQTLAAIAQMIEE